jgi:hypothetical protein
MNPDTLKTLWQEFKRLAPANRGAFYAANIWPLVKLKFNTEPLEPRFDISFHTVGTSPEPVILAALNIGAPRIFLLHTPETKIRAQQVLAELEHANVRLLEVTRSDSTAVYNAVFESLNIEDNLANPRIALEITGGTKAMVSSLSMLAVALQARGKDVGVYYLENPRWDAEARRPEPGFEELVRLELPDFPVAHVRDH